MGHTVRTYLLRIYESLTTSYEGGPIGPSYVLRGLRALGFVGFRRFQGLTSSRRTQGFILQGVCFGAGLKLKAHKTAEPKIHLGYPLGFRKAYECCARNLSP